jgi:hypothetical protein
MTRSEDWPSRQTRASRGKTSGWAKIHRSPRTAFETPGGKRDEILMGMFDNEVAADNRMRQFESLSKSPVGPLLTGVETVAQAASLVTSAPIAGVIAKSLGIAKRFTSGLGVATLDENIDHLGRATEMAISRVSEKFEAEASQIQERIESPEFLEGVSAAVLQAQRTKQKKRLERMAWILANGVAENDLEPESLDDMMRAALELKERDVLALGLICSRQAKILSDAEKWPQHWFDSVRKDWQASGLNESGKSDHVGLKSSLSRLAAFGFIIAIPPATTTNSPGREPFALLREGKRFYERLQEIGRDSS